MISTRTLVSFRVTAKTWPWQETSIHNVLNFCNYTWSDHLLSVRTRTVSTLDLWQVKMSLLKVPVLLIKLLISLCQTNLQVQLFVLVFYAFFIDWLILFIRYSYIDGLIIAAYIKQIINNKYRAALKACKYIVLNDSHYLPAYRCLPRQLFYWMLPVI